jgi:DNA-binding MarR family transcriptional regulator
MTTTSRPAPHTRARAAEAGSHGHRGLGFEQMADDLLNAMGGIRRCARREAERPEELAALTGAQLELVRLLRRRPGVSVTEAAVELHLAPNTVSTLVRQLSDMGYLVRRLDARDRRIARLELSKDLGRKVGAFRDRRVAVVADAMRALPLAEQRRLRHALGTLLKLSAAMEHAEDRRG